MTRKQVLPDHKRIGKRFIPPLATLPLSEVSWVNQILPEIIWLALAHRQLDYATTVDIAVRMGRKAGPLTGPQAFFGGVSSFSQLSDSSWHAIRKELSDHALLQPLMSALSPLLRMVPTCPLNNLSGPSKVHLEPTPDDLQKVAKTVADLIDRRSVASTKCQATWVYLGFVLGRLQVAPGLTLENFPAIADYPETEESVRVAAAVRALVNMLANVSAPSSPWPSEFWQRGFDLTECITLDASDLAED